MDLGLREKIVVITGGGSGIGAETAFAFAEEGAWPVILDINGKAAENTHAKITASGCKALHLSLDVTSLDAVQAAFTEIRESFGNVHVLINNAGFPRDAYLTQMKPEDWESVVNVVLKGAFNCTRTVLPVMMNARHGRIINIASRAYLGNPGQANYSAAKAGLIGFTRAIALECGKFDITSNAIAPGLVATPLVSSRPDFEDMAQRFAASTPIRRIGLPRDVAAAALFLASDQAGYITGETVHVTGGRYA